MLKRMKRVAAGLLVAVFLLNISAVSEVNNLTQVEAARLVTKGTVTSSILNIRVSKSTKAKKITTLKRGAKVTLLSNNSKWVAVKVKGRVGYTQGKYIRIANGGTASATTMSKGQSVVNYAKRFLGNPYRWGGTSLTRGADCSGYVMSVYRHFGKSLPHSSYAQRRVGRRVSSLSKAKPGDIICYSGHVAIYMGNNRVIHASNRKDGIKITKGAAYRSIVTIRRIF
nr:C40 family peptidase [uncultured Anaerobutyricum sp.]